ncbi:MAG TPA: hypothetical protein VEJ36_05995 [Nitrososphaerales archaeon]|nr:hypothetical protein [Nitrososphaerales archaeon]
MKIVLGSWFSLPRLGTEAYASLIRSGAKYESGMGFMLPQDCDLSEAVRIIRKATGEGVQLAVRCVVCLKEACVSCPYDDVCDRSVVSPMCLCGVHSSGEGAYEGYVAAFLSSLSE